MRNSLSAVLLVAAACLGAEDKPASLGGVVLDSATGAPILRAHVSLTGMPTQRPTGGSGPGAPASQDRQPRNYGAMTDAEGKFSFPRSNPAATSSARSTWVM